MSMDMANTCRKFVATRYKRNCTIHKISDDVIDHLVVNPKYRNEGIGTKALNELVGMLDKTVCLEVEPPEGEMACRRIGFYQRNKFFLNEYSYMQPPMSKGKNAIPLLIMTSGGEVDEKNFEQIKTTLYTEVYKII